MRRLGFMLTLLAVLCGMTAWGQTFVVDGISYGFADNERTTLQVVATSQEGGYSGAIAIPANVQVPEEINAEQPTLPVVRINKDAFRNATGLTSITIGSNVTFLGSYAFAGCTGLTSVTIPAGVETIGDNAFNGCSELTEVTIGSGVKELQSGAFSGCAKLGKAVFASIESLCGMTFVNEASNPLYTAKHLYISGNDNEVTELTIPNTVTEIKKLAFANAISLTTVTLPENLTTIGINAFSGCYQITSLTIPNAVTNIGAFAFYGCSAMTSVAIGSGVTSIGQSAFGNCYPERVTFASMEKLCGIDFANLYSNPLSHSGNSTGSHLYFSGSNSEVFEITIPDRLETIKKYTFAGASYLTRVNIPGSVTSIGESAFYNCSSLLVADFATIQQVQTMQYGDEYSNPLKYANTLAIAGNAAETIELSDDVSDYAFKDCHWLKKVTLNAGVTSIGKGAFQNCTQLAEVVINTNELTTIGEAAFFGCITMNAFQVPSTVTKIGKQAFRNCRFTSFTIPSSVTELGEEVFMGCSTLKTFSFLPEITAIPLGFFNGCSRLETFALPSTVVTIGERAFNGCKALTSIPMGTGLTTIGRQAFESCSGLTSLILKETVVTDIKDYAFNGCTSIATVSLPATLVSIGDYAFKGCTSLKDVYSYAESVPVAYENSFESKGNITLHVVSGTAQTNYENPSLNWTGFKQVVIMGDRTLTFIVNDNAGEPFHTITLEEGTPINTSDIPVPTDGIFSGWSPEVPSIMPNEDMTFYGYTSTQQEIGGIRYHLYPDELRNNKSKRAVVIAGASGPYTHENLVIPAEVSQDGVTYPVAAIDAGAFEGCADLITITLPNSITEIGSGAFKDCSKLLSVNIPENVTVISENLFMGCKSLPTITWNNKTEEIQSSAFRGCTTLEVSTLPTGIRKIGSIAFGGCENIKEMVIPATLTEMGSEVFLSCKLLKKATFQDGFTLQIPAGTFRDCSSLEEVTLLGAMKNIGEKAFYYCVKLKTLVVPEGIQTIGNSAFEGCIQLSHITLPNTIQVLGDRAFANCLNIKQLTIDRITAPAAPTTSFAAELATNSEKAYLYVPAEATGYNKAPWIYFILETRVAKQLTYIVDDGVGTVDGTAEGYQKTVTLDVMVGDKIEPREEPQDGDREFSGWQGLPDVMPAEDVTVTGKFRYEVKYYEKFDEGENAEDHRLLGDQTFLYFYDDDTVEPTEGLTRENQSYTIQYYRGEMTEENLLEGLGKMPASDINAVVTYTLSEDNLTVGNINYKIWVLENRAEVIASPNAAGTVVIPQSVTYEEKDYPVTAIHERAFFGLQAITGMTLPEGLESIGKWAFRDCRFTTITIPESVTTIDDEAFLYCQKLESVDAEKSTLTTLSPRVFQYCTALKSIKLPAGLETIGEGAFQSCGSLTAITIPQSVTTIDRNAFFGCIKLTTLVVPNGVTAIGEMAFFNCTQLSSISLPASLTTIDKQAFAGCLNITQLIVNRATPPTTVYENSFDSGLDQETARLYVPEGAVEAYSGTPWSYFTIASLVEKTLTYVVDGDTESAQTETYLVGEKITPLAAPENEGREFSGWNNLPDVMPADDLTVYGYFKYQVKYAFAADSETEGITLPGELSHFCNDEVKLADILENMPQRDNYSYTYTLAPAGLVAEGSDGFTMPAQDVTVTVRYTLSEIVVPGDANNQFVNYKVWILENERHAEVIASPQASGAVTIPATITYEGKEYPVTAIQDQAFMNCVGILGMTLSEGLQTIGKQAFRNCRHRNFTTLTIPSTVTEIGEEAFRYCMSLQTVDASGCQVTALQSYVFQQCEALNSIQLPATLQTIGEGTFLACNALVSIDFPATVTNIAQSAFSMCYNIGNVKVQSTTMPTADELSFENSVYANATLTVPEGVVVADLPSPWNKFGTIQAGSEASSNQCPVPTVAYDKGKLIFACADAECTIVYDITVDDAGKKFGTNQGTETKDLKKTYRITAYARKQGMANSTDAVATITWQNGSPVFTGFTGGVTLEDFANPRGDVNGDNIVNIADVTAVINIINGK